MGYVGRVRVASFMAGAAVASIPGICLLYNDYKLAHHSISHQMDLLHNSLNNRVSALENFKQAEVTQQVEATD